jgi:hypothetical protein
MEETISKYLDGFSFLPYMLVLIALFIAINTKTNKTMFALIILDVIAAASMLMSGLCSLYFHYHPGLIKTDMFFTHTLFAAVILLIFSGALKRKLKEKI